MCNPRRLEVRLTREVSQSWAEEITRAAQGSTRVGSEVSAVLPLTQDFAEGLLTAFLRALGADDRWISIEDGYELDVPDGVVRYDRATGELSLRTMMTAEVHAEVELRQRVSGMEVTEISATGKGKAERDEEARRRAIQNAESLLDAREAEAQRDVEREAREAAQRAVDDVAAALERTAQSALRAELEERAAERHATLQAQTQARLEAIQAIAMNSISQCITTAVRSTVTQFAAENNGIVTRDEEADGILEIQLEWERP